MDSNLQQRQQQEQVKNKNSELKKKVIKKLDKKMAEKVATKKVFKKKLKEGREKLAKKGLNKAQKKAAEKALKKSTKKMAKKAGKELAKKGAKNGFLSFLATPPGWFLLAAILVFLLLIGIMGCTMKDQKNNPIFNGNALPEKYLKIEPTQEKDKTGNILYGLTDEAKALDYKTNKWDQLLIPNRVAYIAQDAFAAKNVPQGFIEEIGWIRWETTPNSFSLLNDFKIIGDNAFSGLSNIQLVELPVFNNNELLKEGQPKLGNNCFAGCEKLCMFGFQQTTTLYYYVFGSGMLDGTCFNTSSEKNQGLFFCDNSDVAKGYYSQDGWKNYPIESWGGDLKQSIKICPYKKEEI